MAENLLRKLSGSISMTGGDGITHTFTIEGTKLPENFKDIPAYVGELVKKGMTGASDHDVVELRKQIDLQQKKIESLIAELKDAKESTKRIK